LLLVLAPFPAAAQTTFATITGTVTDPSGAAVAGAQVVAVHAQSGYRYTAQSNAAGNYTLAQLREGEYTLRAQASGFKEFVAQQITLAAMDVRRIDVPLEVGTLQTTVEVSAGATLIETETARISDSKTSVQLTSLPLNTRSLWNFVGLSPGVIQADSDTATRRFAGSTHNQSDASIDGITLSNQYDGTQISPLVSQIESFEEVRIDMANNTAEFGGIGQVTIITKSGGNRVRGSGFDYYSTPWFRARNPFSPQRGTGIRHNPGGSVGGPVVIPKLYDGHNRSFFFFSFETSRGSQVLSNLRPTVPIPAWREGDFSRESTAIRDPFAGNAPFPGNVVPGSRINQVSRKIQERFYPLPNSGDVNTFRGQNFQVQLLRPFDPNTYWTTRGDHRFSEKHFVFGRYTWNRSHSRDFDSSLPAIGRRWQTRDTRAVQLSYTAALSVNWINEFRWGFAYNDNPRNGPLMGLEVVKSLGLTGLWPDLPDVNGVYRVSFSGLGITGISQTAWRHPGFKNFAQQFQEQMSWFRGRHNLKAGVLLGRTLYQDHQMPDALFGSASFSNRFTGHPYADFLLGVPTSASRAAPTFFIDRLRWSWDFFLTDEYKIRPDLTLNLGLRYELHPGYREQAGRQATFDVVSSRIVVPDGSLKLVSPLMPKDYVPLVEASSAGYDAKRLLRNDTNNFAPRVGIAWRPFGPRTVFRTGFGIFYDVVPRAVSAGGSPFIVNEPSFTNPTPVPTLVLPQVFPASVGGPTTISLPGAIRVDLRDPYSMQYNFTIEHQRWSSGFRISYIGTNTRQGEWGYNYNQPLPDNRPYVDKPRAYPKYPAITYTSNGAGHQYHSLTLETDRRFAAGLSYQLSWVWARDIGDLERGASPENAYDRRRERGVWIDIPTHRVTGNLYYELPFGRGKRWLSGASRWVRGLAGGWEFTSVYSFHSGEFLTPQWTLPDPVGTAYTTSRTPAQVTIRPNYLRNANLPKDQRSTARWFDITAFGAPALGTYGTSARGVIFGPGSQIVNGGITRRFNLKESLRLGWELTATNLFNTPNYSNPDMSITSLANAGVITGTGGVSQLDPSGARAFRTGLRLEW